MRPIVPGTTATLRATMACAVLASCTAESTTQPDAASTRVPVVPRASVAAMDPAAPVLVGAGNIGTCSSTRDEMTASILDTVSGTVFTLGDNAYANGTSSDFANCYGPSWGRHKARTRPTPGEIEYRQTDAAPYFDYFGAAADARGKGYYSYDVGDWHVVALNSSIAVHAWSEQSAWLRADLAASARQCTLVYWHYPLYASSGKTVRSWIRPIWDVLYPAGVDVVVNAEARVYERFAPQAPDATADPAFGIRQFIVGTGGYGLDTFDTPQPNSEARIQGVAGVLALSLGSGSYSWKFIPVGGAAAMDVGSGSCHGRPAPVAVPGGPYAGTDSVRFDGRASYDPTGVGSLTYAWSFGDGATGTGATPLHVYSAPGSYVARLVVKNANGVTSDTASASVTIANDPAPEILEATYLQRYPDRLVALRVVAADDGGPWSYTVKWGDGAVSTGSVQSLNDPIITSHGFSSLGAYVVDVTVRDPSGHTASQALPIKVRQPASLEVFAGVGDMHARCDRNNDDATAALVDNIAGTVFTIGDHLRDNAPASEFEDCYGPGWGRHKARTYATVGNHEYDLGNADAAFDYFGDRIGPRGKGYYSFDLGAWHIVVLNDNGSYVPYASGSAQDTWLRDDLAANTRRCILALWHRPRFYSAKSATQPNGMKNLWDRLYAAGAELILNGHMHQYERFAPQTPLGVRDDAQGIRQFIVGTGGSGMDYPTVPRVNNEVMATTQGVMKLTLTEDSYTWEFLAAPGFTFKDFGTGSCR